MKCCLNRRGIVLLFVVRHTALWFDNISFIYFFVPTVKSDIFRRSLTAPIGDRTTDDQRCSFEFVTLLMLHTEKKQANIEHKPRFRSGRGKTADAWQYVGLYVLTSSYQEVD